MLSCGAELSTVSLLTSSASKDAALPRARGAAALDPKREAAARAATASEDTLVGMTGVCSREGDKRGEGGRAANASRVEAAAPAALGHPTSPSAAVQRYLRAKIAPARCVGGKRSGPRDSSSERETRLSVARPRDRAEGKVNPGIDNGRVSKREKLAQGTRRLGASLAWGCGGVVQACCSPDGVDVR